MVWTFYDPFLSVKMTERKNNKAGRHKDLLSIWYWGSILNFPVIPTYIVIE